MFKLQHAALAAALALIPLVPLNADARDRDGVQLRFDVSSGRPYHRGHDCHRESNVEWYHGRRAEVVSTICADRYGRPYVVPGSTHVERYLPSRRYGYHRHRNDRYADRDRDWRR